MTQYSSQPADEYLAHDSVLGEGQAEDLDVLYGVESDFEETLYKQGRSGHIRSIYTLFGEVHRPDRPQLTSALAQSLTTEPVGDLLGRPRDDILETYKQRWQGRQEHKQVVGSILRRQTQELRRDLDRLRPPPEDFSLLNRRELVQRLYDRVMPSHQEPVRTGFLSRPQLDDYRSLFRQGSFLSASYFQFQQLEVLSEVDQKARFELALQMPTRMFTPDPIEHKTAYERQFDHAEQAHKQLQMFGENILAAGALDAATDRNRRVFRKVAPLSFHPKLGYVAEDKRTSPLYAWIGTQNITSALTRNRTLENILVFRGKAYWSRQPPSDQRLTRQAKLETEVSSEIRAVTRELMTLGAPLPSGAQVVVPGMLQEALARTNRKYVKVDSEIFEGIRRVIDVAARSQRDKVVISSWQFGLFSLRDYHSAALAETKQNLLQLAQTQRLKVVLDRQEYLNLIDVMRRSEQNQLDPAEVQRYDIEFLRVLMQNQALLMSPSAGLHHEKSLFVFDESFAHLRLVMTGSANFSRFSMLPLREQPQQAEALWSVFQRAAQATGLALPSKETFLRGTAETEASVFIGAGIYAKELEQTQAWGEAYLESIQGQVMAHLNYVLRRELRAPPQRVHVQALAELRQQLQVLQRQLEPTGVRLTFEEKYGPHTSVSHPGGTPGTLMGLRITVASRFGIPGYLTSLQVTTTPEGDIILQDRNKILPGSVYFNRDVYERIVPGSQEVIAPGTAKVLSSRQTLLAALVGIGAAMNEQAFGSLLQKTYTQLRPFAATLHSQFLLAAFKSGRHRSAEELVKALAEGRYSNARAFYGRDLTREEVQARYETLKPLVYSLRDLYATSTGDRQIRPLSGGLRLFEILQSENQVSLNDLMYTLVMQSPLARQLMAATRNQVGQIVDLVLAGAIEQNSSFYGYNQLQTRVNLIGTTIDDRLPTGGLAAYNPLPITATGGMGIGSMGRFLRLIGAEGYAGQATLGGLHQIGMAVSSLNEETIAFYDFARLAQSAPQLGYFSAQQVSQDFQQVMRTLNANRMYQELSQLSQYWQELLQKPGGFYFFMLPSGKIEQFLQRLKNLVGGRQAASVAPSFYERVTQLDPHLSEDPAEIYQDEFRRVMGPSAYQRFREAVQRLGSVEAALQELRRQDTQAFATEKGVLAPPVRKVAVVYGPHQMTDFYYLNAGQARPYGFSMLLAINIPGRGIQNRVALRQRLQAALGGKAVLLPQAHTIQESHQLVSSFLNAYSLVPGSPARQVRAALAEARLRGDPIGETLDIRETRAGHYRWVLRSGLYSLQEGGWVKVGAIQEDGRIVIGMLEKRIGEHRYHEPLTITSRAFTFRHWGGVAYFYGDLEWDEDPLTGKVQVRKPSVTMALPTSGIRSFDLFKGPGIFLTEEHFTEQMGLPSDTYALATTTHFKSYSFTTAHRVLTDDLQSLRRLTGRQLAVLLFPILGDTSNVNARHYYFRELLDMGVPEAYRGAYIDALAKLKPLLGKGSPHGQSFPVIPWMGLAVLLGGDKAAQQAIAAGDLTAVAKHIAAALSSDHKARQLRKGFHKLLDYFEADPLHRTAVNIGDPNIRALLAVVDTIDVQRQLMARARQLPGGRVLAGDVHAIGKGLQPDQMTPEDWEKLSFILAAEGVRRQAPRQFFMGEPARRTPREEIPHAASASVGLWRRVQSWVSWVGERFRATFLSLMAQGRSLWAERRGLGRGVLRTSREWISRAFGVAEQVISDVWGRIDAYTRSRRSTMGSWFRRRAALARRLAHGAWVWVRETPAASLDQTTRQLIQLATLDLPQRLQSALQPLRQAGQRLASDTQALLWEARHQPHQDPLIYLLDELVRRGARQVSRLIPAPVKHSFNTATRLVGDYVVWPLYQAGRWVARVAGAAEDYVNLQLDRLGAWIGESLRPWQQQLTQGRAGAALQGVAQALQHPAARKLLRGAGAVWDLAIAVLLLGSDTKYRGPGQKTFGQKLQDIQTAYLRLQRGLVRTGGELAQWVATQLPHWREGLQTTRQRLVLPPSWLGWARPAWQAARHWTERVASRVRRARPDVTPRRAAAWQAARRWLEKATPHAQRVWQDLRSQVVAAWQYVQPWTERITSRTRQAWQELTPRAAAAWQDVQESLRPLPHQASQIAATTWLSLRGAVAAAWHSEPLQAVRRQIAPPITALWSRLQQAAPTAWLHLAGLARQARQLLVERVQPAWQTLSTHLRAQIPRWQAHLSRLQSLAAPAAGQVWQAAVAPLIAAGRTAGMTGWAGIQLARRELQPAWTSLVAATRWLYPQLAAQAQASVRWARQQLREAQRQLGQARQQFHDWLEEIGGVGTITTGIADFLGDLYPRVVRQLRQVDWQRVQQDIRRGWRDAWGWWQTQAWPTLQQAAVATWRYFTEPTPEPEPPSQPTPPPPAPASPNLQRWASREGLDQPRATGKAWTVYGDRVRPQAEAVSLYRQLEAELGLMPGVRTALGDPSHDTLGGVRSEGMTSYRDNIIEVVTAPAYHIDEDDALNQWYYQAERLFRRRLEGQRLSDDPDAGYSSALYTLTHETVHVHQLMWLFRDERLYPSKLYSKRGLAFALELGRTTAGRAKLTMAYLADDEAVPYELQAYYFQDRPEDVLASTRLLRQILDARGKQRDALMHQYRQTGIVARTQQLHDYYRPETHLLAAIHEEVQLPILKLIMGGRNLSGERRDIEQRLLMGRDFAQNVLQALGAGWEKTLDAALTRLRGLDAGTRHRAALWGAQAVLYSPVGMGLTAHLYEKGGIDPDLIAAMGVLLTPELHETLNEPAGFADALRHQLDIYKSSTKPKHQEWVRRFLQAISRKNKFSKPLSDYTATRTATVQAAQQEVLERLGPPPDGRTLSTPAEHQGLAVGESARDEVLLQLIREKSRAIAILRDEQTGPAPMQTIFGSRQTVPIELQNLYQRSLKDLDMLGVESDFAKEQARAFADLLGLAVGQEDRVVPLSVLGLPIPGGQIQRFLDWHGRALYHSPILGERGTLTERQQLYTILRTALPGGDEAIEERLEVAASLRYGEEGKTLWQLTGLPYILGDDASPEAQRAQQEIGWGDVTEESPRERLSRLLAGEVIGFFEQRRRHGYRGNFLDYLHERQSTGTWDVLIRLGLIEERDDAYRLHHLLPDVLGLSQRDYYRIALEEEGREQARARYQQEIYNRLTRLNVHSQQQVAEQLRTTTSEDYLKGIQTLATPDRITQRSVQLLLPPMEFVADQEGGFRPVFHWDMPESYTRGILLGPDIMRPLAMTFRGFTEPAVETQVELLHYLHEVLPPIVAKLQQGESLTRSEALSLQEYESLLRQSGQAAETILQRRIAARALGDRVTTDGGVAVAVASWSLDPHSMILGRRGFQTIQPMDTEDLVGSLAKMVAVRSLGWESEKQRRDDLTRIRNLLPRHVSPDQLEQVIDEYEQQFRNRDTRPSALPQLKDNLRNLLESDPDFAREMAAVARSGAPIGAAGDALKENWMRILGVEEADPDLGISAAQASTLLMLPAVSAIHAMLGDFDGDTFQFVHTQMGRYTQRLTRLLDRYQALSQEREQLLAQFDHTSVDRRDLYDAYRTQLEQDIAEVQRELDEASQDYKSFLRNRERKLSQGLGQFKLAVGAMLGLGKSLLDKMEVGEVANLLSQARSVTDQMHGGEVILKQVKRALELQQLGDQANSPEVHMLQSYAELTGKERSAWTQLTEEELVTYYTTRYQLGQALVDSSKSAQKMLGTVTDAATFEALQATIGHLGTQMIGQTYNLVAPLAMRMFTLGAVLQLLEGEGPFHEALRARAQRYLGDRYDLDALRSQFFALQSFLQNMQQAIRDSLKAKTEAGAGLLADEKLQKRLLEIAREEEEAWKQPQSRGTLTPSDIADKKRQQAIQDFIYERVGAEIGRPDFRKSPGTVPLTMFASFMELSELANFRAHKPMEITQHFIENRANYLGDFLARPGELNTRKARFERYVAQADPGARPEELAYQFMKKELAHNITAARVEFILQNIDDATGGHERFLQRVASLSGDLDPTSQRMLEAYQRATQQGYSTIDVAREVIRSSIGPTQPLDDATLEYLVLSKQVIQAGGEAQDVGQVVNASASGNALMRQIVTNALRLNKIQGAENQLSAGLWLLKELADKYADQAVTGATPTQTRQAVASITTKEDLLHELGIADDPGWQTFINSLFTERVTVGGKDVRPIDWLAQQQALLRAYRDYQEAMLEVAQEPGLDPERSRRIQEEAVNVLEEQVRRIMTNPAEFGFQQATQAPVDSFVAEVRREIERVRTALSQDVEYTSPEERVTGSLFQPDPRLQWVELALVPLIVGTLTGHAPADERILLTGLDLIQSVAQAGTNPFTLTSEFARETPELAAAAAKQAQSMRFYHSIAEHGLVVGALQGLANEIIYRQSSQLAYELVEAIMPKGKHKLPGAKGAGIVAAEIMAGMFAMTATRAVVRTLGPQADILAQFDHASQVLAALGAAVARQIADPFTADPEPEPLTDFDPVEEEFLQYQTYDHIELGTIVLDPSPDEVETVETD